MAGAPFITKGELRAAARINGKSMAELDQECLLKIVDVSGFTANAKPGEDIVDYVGRLRQNQRVINAPFVYALIVAMFQQPDEVLRSVQAQRLCRELLLGTWAPTPQERQEHVAAARQMLQRDMEGEFLLASDKINLAAELDEQASFEEAENTPNSHTRDLMRRAAAALYVSLTGEKK